MKKINNSAVIKASLVGLVVGVLLGMLGGMASPDGPTPAMIVVNAILYVGIGALYGYFARREGTTEGYAIGGAGTTFISTLLALGLVLALTFARVLPDLLFNGLMGAIGVGGLFINAVLGAIGGAIYAAATRTRTATPPTA